MSKYPGVFREAIFFHQVQITTFKASKRTVHYYWYCNVTVVFKRLETYFFCQHENNMHKPALHPPGRIRTCFDSRKRKKYRLSIYIRLEVHSAWACSFNGPWTIHECGEILLKTPINTGVNTIHLGAKIPHIGRIFRYLCVLVKDPKHSCSSERSSALPTRVTQSALFLAGVTWPTSIWNTFEKHSLDKRQLSTPSRLNDPPPHPFLCARPVPFIESTQNVPFCSKTGQLL